MGIFNEQILRKESEKLFGESFAKSYLARSVPDMLSLVSSISSGENAWDIPTGYKISQDVVAKSRLKSLVKPAIMLFLDQIDADACSSDDSAKELRKAISDAKDLLEGRGKTAGTDEERQYQAVCTLIGATQKAGMATIANFLLRLKRGFGESKEDPKASHFIDEEKLLKCDGPGLMLFELASREIDPTDFGTTVHITSLVEEMEFDMRGSISAVDGYAFVTCGEIKSSASGIQFAKEQCEIRTRVAMKCLSLIHQKSDGGDPFKVKLRIGRVVIPKSAGWTGESTEVDTDNNVSYYIHRL